jgi:hypothetical protein
MGCRGRSARLVALRVRSLARCRQATRCRLDRFTCLKDSAGARSTSTVVTGSGVQARDRLCPCRATPAIGGRIMTSRQHAALTLGAVSRRARCGTVVRWRMTGGGETSATLDKLRGALSTVEGRGAADFPGSTSRVAASRGSGHRRATPQLLMIRSQLEAASGPTIRRMHVHETSTVLGSQNSEVAESYRRIW